MHNLPTRKSEPLTTQDTLRVVAFILVVLPTTFSLNVLVWAVILWMARQS